MSSQELKSNEYVIDKITIEEFHNLYMQNIKGSFFKNDAIRKSYMIEGVVCEDVFKQHQGVSFKIQSDEGNTLNVYLPKRASSKVHLEPGNKVKLYGMFNLYDNTWSGGLDFLEFKASRIMDSGISQVKKEVIIDELNEKGFFDKPKKKLSFKGLDYFRLMVISSKDSNTINEINNCLCDVNFFQTSVHYIDMYSADEIANTITSFDKNNYYDAILIADIGPNELCLFDEMPVLTALNQCNTLIVAAMGNTIANDLGDVVEDGAVSAAKMLLYEYKEEKLRENEMEKNNISISTAYESVLNEKEELENKLDKLLNEKVSLLTKVRSQQKIIIFFGVISFVAVIISILK